MSDEEHNTILLKAPIVQTPADEAPAPLGKLVCLDISLLQSTPDGLEYRLPAGEFTVGRGEECTVQIDSTEVSRVHARFTTYSDRWVIEDTESSNGSRVNDERIAGKTVLTPGDIVHFGQVPFRFDVMVDEGSPDAPAAAGAAPEGPADDEISIEVPQAPPPPAQAAFVAEEELTLDLPGESPAPEPAPVPPAPAAAPAEAPLAHAPPPAGPTGKADVATLREHVPQLVGLLLEHAREGDAAAARVCLEFLVHEEQRLPKELASTGAMSQMVKRILASMTQGELPPRQALDALQAIATARDLLGRPAPKGE